MSSISFSVRSIPSIGRSHEGAAINVFNMARELQIKAAPAKGQCAKPYFYGRDGELERALQKPEGEYGDPPRRQ